MRILVDQCVHDLRNIGNIAMLQVAVKRLRKTWPQASFQVITLAPHLLKLYCPKAYPISPDGRYDWSENISLRNALLNKLPIPVLRLLVEFREEVTHRWTQLPSSIGSPDPESKVGHEAEVKSPIPARGVMATEVEEMNWTARLVSGIELFAAIGGQYMADVQKREALRLLDRLETAIRLRIPTAMLGQGFGPIEDSELRAKARSVLPHVGLIAIRERLAAPKILESLGVEPSKIFLTGDDAIELAYDARGVMRGDGIGVGMRVSHYSEINKLHIQVVREVIQRAAAQYGGRLIEVPISQHVWEADREIIRQILDGYSYTSKSWHRFESPLAIIRRVGGCRLVVTGAFHTAVFALAQGIPSVCLAYSSHYVNKFQGLADQFGAGCELIYLNDPMMREKLEKAIEIAWNSPETVAPHLLDAAKRQIESSQVVYQQIHELVASKNL
jgi:polysaccharide pyruvyl transferase WcaK-like protein